METQNGGLKSHNRAMEVHPGAVEAQNGGLKSHNRAMEGLCRPVVAGSHTSTQELYPVLDPHLCEKSDPGPHPHQSEKPDTDLFLDPHEDDADPQHWVKGNVTQSVESAPIELCYLLAP